MPPYKQQLAAAIAALDASLQPRAQQYELKRVLLQVLRPLLQHHLGGSLATFGSCDNGFWVKGSDIDACLLLPGNLPKAEQLAKLRVAKYLMETFSIGYTEVIPAHVPIAKVLGRDGRNLLDISVSNKTALYNSSFVKKFSSLNSNIQILGRIIKLWASNRGINNRSEGTLSTYTLMLQLFFFLQTRTPPLLPLYKDIEIVGDTHADGTDSPAAATAAATAATGAAAGAARGGVPMWGNNTKISGDRFCGDDPSCLPFISDTNKIKELMEGQPKNEETVEELLKGFFHFYGYALPRIQGEGPLVVDLYDGSLRVGLEEIDPRKLHAYAGKGGGAAETQPAYAAAAAAETLQGPLSPFQEFKEKALWGLHAHAAPTAHAQSSRIFSALPRCAALTQPVPHPTSNSNSSSSSRRQYLGGTAPVLHVRCPLSRCIVNRFSPSAWSSILSEFIRGHLLLEALQQQQQEQQQQQQQQKGQDQQQQQASTFSLLFQPVEVAHKDRLRAETFAYRRFAAALARSRGLLPNILPSTAAAAATAPAAAAPPSTGPTAAAAAGRAAARSR